MKTYCAYCHEQITGTIYQPPGDESCFCEGCWDGTSEKYRKDHKMGEAKVYDCVNEIGVGGGPDGPIVFVTIGSNVALRLSPGDADDLASMLRTNAETARKLGEDGVLKGG